MGRATPATRARRQLTALGVALACLGGPMLPGAVGAPDPDEKRKDAIDRQIEDTRHALEETSADFQRAYAALTATQARVPGVQAAAAAAESRRLDAEGRSVQAQSDLEVAKAAETKAEAELARTRTTLASSERDLSDVAAQMYMQQGLGELSVAMDAQSPAEFADRLEMTGTVLDLQQARIAQLAAARATQIAQESRLSALRAEKVRAEAAARQALAAATSARDQAEAARQAVEQLAAAQQAQSAALQSQMTQEKGRLAGLQSESTKLQKILAERARQAKIKAERERRERLERERREREEAKKKKKPYKPPVKPPVIEGGYLSSAMPGWEITSEFGRRFHPILHYWKLHTGMDFGAPCGTPVYAAAPGTVIMAGWAGGYGNRVVIDHGMVNGVNLVTTYNHMSGIVKWGGTIGRGQQVGYEGTTGMSTGCHLHFETLENGSFVNPRNWL